MARYVVVGAGTIGTLVAEQLAARGDRVTVVARRGRGPAVAGVESVAADAADERLVTRLATGAEAIFNCANPAYHRWPSDWPPIASSLLSSAEASGAVLVTLGNLYVYGAPSSPMSPDSAARADFAKALVRQRMWEDALAAHGAGRVRATEVRASDFVGPRANGVFGPRQIPRILAGRSCRVIGSLDQPHSWTYVDDVAQTLITCADTDIAWGRVWHVATNPARTQRQLIDDVAQVAGVGSVAASVIARRTLRIVGLVSPLVAELPTTLYQFTAPFVIDDTATRRALGLAPTPWPIVLARTVDAYRAADRRDRAARPRGSRR